MVSAIIPARNEEASIARAVESVATQPEVEEIIAVNDQSTDRTGPIMAKLAARIPKLKVLTTGELPAGWIGKNYAASIGAIASHGDWLLFTDADTYHLPGSTQRALTDAADHDAALVSYSPEQEMETFWERALIPVVYWRLSKKYSFEDVNDPDSPNAAANGQYLLIRRDAYHAVGGHSAIANEILEDVALACRVKQAGYKLYFARGQGIVRARMYRTFHAMWEGWTKNLYPLMRGSILALAGDLLVWFALAGIAIVITQRFVRSLDGLTWIGVGAFFAGVGADFAMELRRNRYPLSYIRYFVPGVCLYAAALVASWWKITRGSVAWKGREYPAGWQ